MSDLPKSWTVCKLSDLNEAAPSWNPSRHAGGFDYIDIDAVDNRRQRVDSPKRLASTEAPSRARVGVQAGDVLFSLVRPYLKNIAIVPVTEKQGVASTAFCRVRPPIGVDSSYLFNYLQQDRVISSLPTYGNSPPSARDDEFFAQSVPLAPEGEQQRMVAKLDELFSDLDAGAAALQRAQANLKRYRASVLKAAVEGRLTAEWRQANPPSETGAELLARLLRERRARWEAAQLAKFEASGKAPPKDWRKKYIEPAAPDTSKLSALPNGWCWATVEQLVQQSEYGTSVKCDYEAEFQPVLRIPNIAKGEIDLADIKFSTLDLNQAPSEYLEVGDVLVCRTNGSIKLVGKCAFVRSSLDGAYHFASYLLRFRLLETAILPAWLTSYMSSVPGRAFIESKAASAAGQHNISLSTLHHMPVPLPPAVEIEQALMQVSQVLAVCERQDSDTAKGVQRAKLLRQSILKHAFTGKLVPQDPNDEPASVLLERIRAARAATPAKPKSRRAATRAKPAKTTSAARTPRKPHGPG
ncbi:MAG TPA: hypothetical protein VLC71_03040 [Thermomonas sp.]|nr:hypothetical protein [Thermomonas sp.]